MTWFALAIIFLVVELFTGSFYLLVLSLAFALTGAIDWMWTLSDAAALTLCAVFSLIGIVVVIRWHKRQKRSAPVEGERDDDDLDLGQTVTVASMGEAGVLRVHYRGTQWQAKSADNTLPEAGQSGVIVGRDSNILLVRFDSTAQE
ncbi:MAG: NfeD family protein [Neisseria sp.]|nr:NfeD family protein [Neisseria sp.]